MEKEFFDNFINTVFCVLVSIFFPIAGIMIAVMLIGFFSSILGYRSSAIHNNEEFSGKKFFKFFAELGIIIFSMTSIACVCWLLGIDKGTMETIIRFLGIFSIYLYVRTIIKNARRFLPTSTFLRFLQYLLDAEFIAKNNIIEDFKNQKCKLDEQKICDDCGKCIT